MKTIPSTLAILATVFCAGVLAACTTTPAGSSQGVSVTAGEAKEAASDTMHRTGNAIKRGAAKADDAIQDTVGKGSSSSNYPSTRTTQP